MMIKMMVMMMVMVMRRTVMMMVIVQAKLMGKRTDEVAKMVVDHYKLPMEPKDWIDRSRCIYWHISVLNINIVIIVISLIIARKVYDELFPSVAALPGVAKLVHHLAKNKVTRHHPNYHHHCRHHHQHHHRHHIHYHEQFNIYDDQNP